MKKLLPILFALCLLFSLASCNSKTAEPVTVELDTSHDCPEEQLAEIVPVVASAADSAETDAGDNTVTEAEPMPEETAAPAAPAPTAATAPVVPSTPAPEVPATPAPATPTHTHEWSAIKGLVHHDAVTEQFKVVDQPATEGHFEGGSYDVMVCRCGAEFTSGADWEAHSMASGEGHGGWTASVRSNQVWIDGQPEVSHTETRVISDAWDEEVITGYVCGSCGATK